MRENLFLFHSNIVTKKRGEKRAKQFFRNTRIVRSEIFGKISPEKGRKIFLYSTNIITKKCGKNRRNNSSRNTRIVRAKNVGKKIVGRMGKKLFLYSHEYRDQKMGGKNARNNSSRNTRILRQKLLGKKSWEKVRKNVFYIHTNIVTK